MLLGPLSASLRSALSGPADAGLSEQGRFLHMPFAPMSVVLGRLSFRWLQLDQSALVTHEGTQQSQYT